MTSNDKPRSGQTPRGGKPPAGNPKPGQGSASGRVRPGQATTRPAQGATKPGQGASAARAGQGSGAQLAGRPVTTARPGKPGSGKPGSGKPGSGKPGSGSRPGPVPRPGQKGPGSKGVGNRYVAQTRGNQRDRGRLFAFGSIGLVIVVVIVFGVIALTSSTPKNANANSRPPAPASLVNALVTIPASVFNSVGTGSANQVPFVKTTGQPLLKSGALAQVVYMGGEFCPYCGIDRWSIIAALSRFGTFSGLELMSSSKSDVFPGTPTFTFYTTKYKSPYFVFTPLEVENVNRDNLTPIPKSLNAVIAKYGSSTYFPSNTTGIGFPFLDFGNQYLESGTDNWLNPALIDPLTRAEIAAAMAEPSNPAALAIDAEANFISAAVCSVDGNMPANVCTSSGVKAAAKSLSTVKPTK